MDFESLSAEYRRMWDSATITPARASQAKRAADKVVAGRPHYETVSGATGVPWYFIGLAHMRESYCNFGTHLHNGDSLRARTYHVPAGRPAKGQPPFTWDESAIDALTIKGLQNISEWPIERTLYELERYNGFGYRRPGRGPTPYLWADTSAYHAGKFVRDGVYDPGAVDPQDGCVAVLKAMLDMDPTILEGASIAHDAVAAPKAIDSADEAEAPPSKSEQHQEAHQNLEEQSASYSWLNWVRKKLGLPIAGAAGGASMLDDPMGALNTALGFLKTYGLELVAGAVVVLMFLEGYAAVQRQKRIRDGQ